MIIGLIISSTTSSIIVFAQELVPHRFGMISGVFFGVAFGIGGLGAAVLGKLADHTGIAFVYQICSFLPAIGLLAVFLPKMPARASASKQCRRLRRSHSRRAHFVNTFVSNCGDFAVFARVNFNRGENNCQRKSTLKIRVKRRLSIWCHRPAVSF